MNFQLEDQAYMRAQLFLPTFCYVDVDSETIPTVEGYVPTTVIKTPKGFHLYFEDRPFDRQENSRLCSLFGQGSAYPTQLLKEGTVLKSGFVYTKVPL